MPCRTKQALRHSIAQPLDRQQQIGYSQQAQLERQRWWGRFAQALRARRPPGSDVTHLVVLGGRVSRHEVSSQRSLHNAPIFRLLLKVAVNGTHQCDYSNFCGSLGSQRLGATLRRSDFSWRATSDVQLERGPVTTARHNRQGCARKLRRVARLFTLLAS